jgi:hypothetical protein
VAIDGMKGSKGMGQRLSVTGDHKKTNKGYKKHQKTTGP